MLDGLVLPKKMWSYYSGLTESENLQKSVCIRTRTNQSAQGGDFSLFFLYLDIEKHLKNLQSRFRLEKVIKQNTVSKIYPEEDSTFQYMWRSVIVFLRKWGYILVKAIHKIWRWCSAFWMPKKIKKCFERKNWPVNSNGGAAEKNIFFLLKKNRILCSFWEWFYLAPWG